MKTSLVRARILLLVFAGFASLVVATVSHAQSDTADKVQQLNRRAAIQQVLENQNAEESAFVAFRDVKPDDPDKKIKLGEAFLGTYPKSQYAESVDVGLTNAYYAKQDWKNFYASADRALALQPNELDVLVTVGWVIPHVYDPNDPDAEKQLEKAETYEKRAIQSLATVSRPVSMTDAQFSEFKTQKNNQAHSALGLVYFRRQDYANSVTELQQAMQDNPSPDQTDLFVLGFSLEKLNRHAEAAEAFDRCSQVPGSLQEPCKQNAANAKTRAAQSQSK
jgi:tetratricopeptide (TPR) repeat protein